MNYLSSQNLQAQSHLFIFLNIINNTLLIIFIIQYVFLAEILFHHDHVMFGWTSDQN